MVGSGQYEAHAASSPRNDGGRRERTVMVVAEEPLRARAVKVLIEDRLRARALCVESLERAGRMLGRPSDTVLWLGEEFGAPAAEETQALRERHPEAGVLVVARRADVDAVHALLAQDARRLSFLVGAKLPRLDQIASLLDQLVDGRCTALDASVLAQLLRPRAWTSGNLASLTEPEREVLELVAMGLRNREIARRLYKSEKAIEKHVSQIFTKLALHDPSDPAIDRRVTAVRIFITAAAGAPATA